MSNKDLLPAASFMSDHDMIKQLFKENFQQQKDELTNDLLEDLYQVNQEHYDDVSRMLKTQKDEIEVELEEIKTDIKYLKIRNSKATIRKRIALAVFIAVIISALLIIAHILLGKI